MLMTKILPITKAREDLTNLVDRADKLSNEYVITVNGKPKAVLMSFQELDSLRETLDILSNPKLVADIKEAEEQIERGETVGWNELKKELGW